MLNCKTVTKLLSEAQDRKLTLREKLLLKMHFVPCSACQEYASQMQTIRQIARAYTKGMNENAPSIKLENKE